MSGFGFSIPQDQIEDGFTNLPDGTYPFKMIATERKASSKDPSNWYQETKFKVLSGPMADKVHIERYNVGHANLTPKKIAFEQLKKLSKAVGYTGDIGGMDPYWDKPFNGTIQNKARKDDPSKMDCQIVEYSPIGSGLPSIGTVAAAGTVAANPSTNLASVPAAAVAAAAPAGKPWGAARS